MKKLIFIFSLLVMLSGATVSLLKWMKLGPFQEEGVAKEEVIQEEDGDNTVFIDMEPLGIPIFQGNKVAATIQIQVKLETYGEKNAEKIKYIMPVITDAFIRDLHSFMPRLLKAEERVDVLIIKQRLQFISDKVAGKGLIRNVLVQSVIDQQR
jgi:flagellar basal body-associated protein FliL